MPILSIVNLYPTKVEVSVNGEKEILLFKQEIGFEVAENKADVSVKILPFHIRTYKYTFELNKDINVHIKTRYVKERRILSFTVLLFHYLICFGCII